MTVEQLRKAVHTEPFKPFTILMANGTRYRIGHPEVIMVAPKAERTFVVSEDEETYTVLDLFLVAGLEFGNGTARRGRVG